MSCIDYCFYKFPLPSHINSNTVRTINITALAIIASKSFRGKLFLVSYPQDMAFSAVFSLLLSAGRMYELALALALGEAPVLISDLIDTGLDSAVLKELCLLCAELFLIAVVALLAVTDGLLCRSCIWPT